MGIIKILKNWLQKTRIKKAFGPYFDKKTIKTILSGKFDSLNQLQELEIEFILIKININSNDPAYPAVTAGDVIEIALKYGTIDIFSNIIAIYINWPGKQEQYPINRKEIAAELVSILGKKISIVHGRSKCLCGMYGSISRFHYGVILPGIFNLLSQLNRNRDGQITDAST